MNRAMDDILTINVNIDGFRIPLKISRSDEEVYRKAEKIVVERLNHFRTRYPQRTYEEILKFVALQVASDLAHDKLTLDISPVIDKLKELEEELNKTLEQE